MVSPSGLASTSAQRAMTFSGAPLTTSQVPW